MQFSKKQPLETGRSKIALCLFKYFSHGGLQRDFFRIVNLLAEKYAIEVFTTKWEGAIPNNISLNIISVSGFSNHARMQQFGKKMVQEANEKECQKIISFNKLPHIDIYFAADNCYVWQAKHKHNFLYRLTSRYRCYSALERSVFDSNQTKIITLTHRQKNEYQQIYHTACERFHVLPPDFNSINYLDNHSIQAIRQSHDIKSDDFLILMVCSAFKTKGVDRAINALKYIPLTLANKFHLIVIGNDRPNPFLKLAKKLKINIQFLGARDDVLSYMQAADLLLHPARQEAGGKVLLEAISCGLPTLTTSNCGYAEYIEKSKVGLVLSELVNHKALAEAIIFILTSPQKNLFKQKALDYISKVNFNHLATDAANFITHVVSS